jgi:hypothetical protein
VIIDYSTFRPSMATLKDAGVSSVGRYIGWDCEPGFQCIRKNLTGAELAALRAAGISVWVSFEYATNAATNGAPQGAKDVGLANRQMAALGLAGAGVYYSIDFDLPDYAPKLADTAVNARAKLGPVARYFDAIHAGHPNHSVDAYGGYYAIKRLLDAKLITHGWQTEAWSGKQVDKRAVLVQLIKSVFGAADVNVHGTTSPDWGQFPRPVTPPPAVITDGVLVSAAMGWTGHRMKTADHGKTWTAVNP